MQFRLIVPALAKLGLPIPLGGTSNHFRVEQLKQLGAWDPYNLTEDADLGFRLAARGYNVGFLPFPTREEAPPKLGIWTNQRSRWIKGYMQTWGVRMRTWPKLLRGASLSGFLVLQLTIGAAIISAFIHAPLVLALLAAVAAWNVGGTWPLGLVDGVVLFAAYGVWVLAAAMAARDVGGKALAFFALTTPFYWPLHTLAAIKAGIELVTKPFYWQKTPHGLAYNRSF